jgi:hypothetical protein
MFQEEIEKMSRSDRTLFSETVNNLLYQCFITRKSYDRKSHMFKANPDYLFLERYFSVFEDYLSYMDMQLSQNEEDGVIFVTSGAERNHFRLDPTTTLIIFALRSFYEGQVEKAPEETEVMMTSGQLNALVQDLGLSNVSKRLSSSTIAAVLHTLDGFNVVSRANGTYSDPTYSFFIMPTIRFVISSEKLNALYTFLTKPEEDEETSSFLGSYGDTTEEKEEDDKNPTMGQDIPF